MLFKLKNIAKKTIRKIQTVCGMDTKSILLLELAKERQRHQASQQSVQQPILEVVPTKANSKIIGANWLINFHNNQASEHGEDGVIRKIFEILRPENKWVCEFGAHDPEVISNTWRLINREGWNALLIEADDFYYGKLKEYYRDSTTVHCVNTKVSYEGDEKLDTILKNTPVPANLDFMVIDIDGNDYHVWDEIKTYLAKVVMIEFNASIPTSVAHVQPRNMTLNQGTSLKAMVDLAKRKGYKLIAVTSWNVFFVQEQYYSLFFQEEPLLEDMYVFPAKHPIEMRGFQLYDGTIKLAPWDTMLWHQIDLKHNDYQVLPESFRFFSRKRAMQDFVIDKAGEKKSVAAENAPYLEKIYKMPGNVLSKYAENKYSRYGEDGMIEKIISLIPANTHLFVDVGAGDGAAYSKSKNMITNHGWNGFLLENDPVMREQLQSANSASRNVKVISQEYGLADQQALDEILKAQGVPQTFELLILNVYGMEYYLWESLRHFEPSIVAVQFNPTIPNDVKFVQANDFSVYQGCSLRALSDLAHYKGYELIGVTLETAIFIKRKYFYQIFEAIGVQPFDLDDMFCPLQTQLYQSYDGTILLEGLDRLLWHGIQFDEEKLQVVPKALRKFHQFADADYKKFYYRV